MSAATIAIAAEGVLLALALLFVVALLRSHAEILRRLLALESGHGAGPSAAGTSVDGGLPYRPPASAATPVSAVAGETLHGDAVKIALGPGAPRTLLAFLSSGCVACGPLWAGLHEPDRPMLEDARLVVVTKGTDRERVARLQELAPDHLDVVMSTPAWEAFEIPSTPHFVLVDGSAGILGRGSATSWEQITSLLRDAEADDAVHRARSTRDRAEYAGQTLAASGIGEGHPSLYPSRRPTDPTDLTDPGGLDRFAEDPR
jgi:hypothetical protein